jgi:hypothetical protein
MRGSDFRPQHLHFCKLLIWLENSLHGRRCRKAVYRCESCNAWRSFVLVAASSSARLIPPVKTSERGHGTAALLVVLDE